MKKFLLVIMLLATTFIFSCDDNADKNEINPALLFLFGGNTLTVTASYTGTIVAGKRIYVYLYNETPGMQTRCPAAVYTGSTPGVVTTTDPQTITIHGIVSGTYYVLAFYDFGTGGSNIDSKDDRYLFSGTTVGTWTDSLAAAGTITIPGTSTLTVSIDDTKRLKQCDDPAYVGCVSACGAAFIP
jgi:hypothetical protein